MKIPCVVECGTHGNFDYELFIGEVVGFATESKKPAAIVHVDREPLDWYPLADVTTFDEMKQALRVYKERIEANADQVTGVKS